jgi:hypothetical protein
VDYSPAFYDSFDSCNAACGDIGVGCYTDDGEFYEVGQVLEVSEDWCENYTCSPVDVAGVNYEFILNADLYPWECDPIWFDGCYGDDGTFYLPGEVLEVSDDWCDNYTCYAGFAGYMFILNSDLYPWECEIDPNLGCFEDGEFFPVGAAYYISECEYILCEGDMNWSAIIVIDDCEPNDCINPEQIDDSAVCIEVYMPVCGCDGVTYSNECYAYNYGGVTSWTQGECGSGGDEGCISPNGDFYLPGEIMEVSDIWCENYTCSPVDVAGVNYEFILNADLYPWECDPIWEDGCYGDDGTFYLPGEVLEVSDDWCENYTCIAGFAGFMFLLNSDLYPLECEIDPNLGCFEGGEFFPVGASYYISECEYIICEGDMDWSAIIVIDDCEPNDCIDTSLIDLNAVCYDLWDPVCGCDGVTYSNDCYAINFAGVTSFTPGPCNDVPGGCTYIQALNYQPDASWDDGSCLFAPCNSDCTGDVDGDSSVTVNDILQLLGNFGSICQ